MKQLHNHLLSQKGLYARWHAYETYHHIHWAGFVIVVVAVGAVFSAAFSPFSHLDISLDEQVQAKTSNNEVIKMTADLLNANHDHVRGPKAKSKETKDKLVDVAQKRRSALASLIVNDPKAALESSIPANQQATLSSDVSALLEQNVSLEGVFVEFHTDDFVNKRAEHQFSMVDSKTGKRYQLYLPSYVDFYQVGGMKATVKGIALDGNVAVSEAVPSTTSSRAVILNDITAPVIKKTAVFLINFQNDTTTPYNKATVKNEVFGTTGTTVRAFYREASLGKWDIQGALNADGDVFGWYTIPLTNNPCNYNAFGDAAEVMGAADGYVRSNYDQTVFLWPSTSCAVAVGGQLYGRSYLSTTAVSTIIHEMGHSFSLSHSNSLDCKDTNGVKTSYSADCTNIEYGDGFSVMSGNLHHFGARQKNQKSASISPNWLDPANVTTVTTNGTYTLYPLENPSTGPQLIAINRPYSYKSGTTTISVPDGQYFLDYRRPYGFDNFASADPVVNGVTIMLSTPSTKGGSTHLVNTNPQLGAYAAPLAVGKIFVDREKGITIKTISATATSATVQITFGGSSTCINRNPSLTVTPSSQSDLAGRALTYNFTLTNNDSTDCSATTYNITPTFPANWYATPYAMSETLAPGESVTKTVALTSWWQASPGSYQITETAATVGTGNNYKASVNATYVVLPPASPTPTPSTTPTPSPGVDVIAPVVVNLDVQPRTLSGTATSERVSVSWVVSDAGGSHLANISVYRATYSANGCNDSVKTSCSWQYITGYGGGALSSMDSWSFDAQDTVIAGTYYYGLRVRDLAGNQGSEPVAIKVIKGSEFDTQAPVVASFDVQPRTLSGSAASETITTSWTINDAGGSHFDKLEQYRALYDASGCNDTVKTSCSWEMFRSWDLGGNNWDTFTYTTQDSITAGTWFYGLQVTDKAGNRGHEAAVIKVIKTVPGTPTPTPDTSIPVVSSFDVQPRTLSNPAASSESIYYTWTVTDTGGSHINTVEIYRSSYNASGCNDTDKTACSWSLINSSNIGSYNYDSWNGGYNNDSITAGTYYVSLQVTDKAGNRGHEPSILKVTKNPITSPTPSSTPTLTPTPTQSPDTQTPIVASFDVQPRTLSGSAASENIVSTWTVTDAGGSHLNKLEQYRALYDASGCNDTVKTSCSWEMFRSWSLGPNNWDTFTYSVQDSIVVGTWYYGLQITDQAGNRGHEQALIKVIKTVPGTPTPTPTLTPTPTPTPTPTSTPTPTPPPTSTPTPTPTPPPTATPPPTPLPDTSAPVVTSFDVQPKTLSGSAATESVTASWNITDLGGSFLSRIELYRTAYNASTCNDTVKTACNWVLVKSIFAPTNVTSWVSNTNDSVSQGTYYYGLQAIDKAGNKGFEPTPIKVTKADTSAPVVLLTYPTNGQVNRNTTISITANASDNVGVARVVFSINSVVKCTDTVAPYSCSWLVPAKKDVNYTITAQAFDAQGNASADIVQITAR